MKYTTEVTINLPRTRVTELIDDPENLKKWQPTLVSYEHVSGEPGTVGSQTALVYNMRGRQVEMTETVLSHNLPEEFSMEFTAKGVRNVMASRFIDEGNQTRWVAENDFQFSGIMMLMGLFMGGAIRKQTLADMQRFKAFAESA